MANTLAILNYPLTSPLGEALAGVHVAILKGTINGASPVDTTTQPGSPLATIYSDPQGLHEIANPTMTDGLGNLNVCVENGYYVLQIYGTGVSQQQEIGITIGTGTIPQITFTTTDVLFTNNTITTDLGSLTYISSGGPQILSVNGKLNLLAALMTCTAFGFVSGAENLAYFRLIANIESLDLSTCRSLQALDLAINASDISFPSLDLTNCPLLASLTLTSVRLTSLNLSNQSLLGFLSIIDALVTTLNLSTQPLLTYLLIQDAPISSLQLSGHVHLQHVVCSQPGAAEGSLTTVDVSGCTALTFLVVGGVDGLHVSPLSSITISGCTALTVVIAQFSALPSAQVNAILAQLVAGGLSDGQVRLDGGTSGAPTGAGIANVATLVVRGWSVNTN